MTDSSFDLTPSAKALSCIQEYSDNFRAIECAPHRMSVSAKIREIVVQDVKLHSGCERLFDNLARRLIWPYAKTVILQYRMILV